MAIDPELSIALDARMASTPPATDLGGMRAGFSAAGAALPRPDVGEVTNHVVRIDDREVPVRLYRPVTQGRVPLLIFLHGGAWMFGDLDSHDAACRHLVVAGGCAVAAVAYRLAPEHPFPAGLDDCRQAVAWLLDEAGHLGFDPARVGIGGESAGANLAAVLAQAFARREGVRPMLQLLVHPLVDFRFETTSVTDVSAPGLTIDSLRMVRAAYLQDDADVLNPEASPLLAETLEGGPSAIVLTVEIDPLRDEGEAYALRLAAAGVETTVVRLPGLVHGFMFESVEVPIIGRAFEHIGRLLRRGFGPALSHISET